MADLQYDRDTLELLIEVDERGRRLSSEEIQFIGDLIDADTTTFTLKQAERIRTIHFRRVERYRRRS